MSILFNDTRDTLPQPDSLVFKLSASSITGMTDGQSLTGQSWADDINGIALDQVINTAPTYRTNVLGGLPAVRCAGGGIKIRSPGVLRTAIDSKIQTTLIAFRTINGTGANGFDCIWGAAQGGSYFWASDGVEMGRFYGATAYMAKAKADTFTTIGETSGVLQSHNLNRSYANGGCYVSSTLLASDSGGNDFAIGCWGGPTNTGLFPWNGDLFEILVWNKQLTPAELMQAEMWIRDKYSQPYPWANVSVVPVFMGDSIMAGNGSSDLAHSAHYITATSLGLTYGQYSNIAVGSMTMNEMIAIAPETVAIATTINRPIGVVCFEFANQNDTTTTNGALLLAALKSSPLVKTVFGTSTSEIIDPIAARPTYNAAWDAMWAGSKTNMDSYMPLHLDTHVGVNGSYAAYSSAGDGRHLPDATQPYLAAMFVTGLKALGLDRILDGRATGIKGAYSTRQLFSIYDGPALRARNVSTHVEQDIGFIGGVLDTAAVLRFSAGANTVVVTWYDQSGFRKDLTQTEATAPYIYTGGLLSVGPTRPGVGFGGSKSLGNATLAQNPVNDLYFSAVTANHSVNGEPLVAGTTTNNFELQINGISKTIQSVASSTAVIGVSTIPLLTTSGSVIEAKYNSANGTGAFWVDGQAAGTYTNSRTFAGGGTLVVGVDAGGNATYGSIGELIMFDVVSFARDSTIYTDQQAYWGTPPPTSAAKTLAADPGSYALTGTAATLKQIRKLIAGASSYALTGSAVTLSKVANKTLAANPGSYALTGTAATLRLGRNLVAGASSYTLVGQPATLRLARKLVAAPGSYALTGTAATLARGRKLIATTPSSYTLTGQAAALAKGGAKTLLADVGSYALTGQPATLKQIRKLIAGASSYALTGSAVTLSKVANKTLAANPGSYALTGTAATLKQARKLVAAPGSYALTGTDVLLFKTGTQNLIASLYVDPDTFFGGSVVAYPPELYDGYTMYAPPEHRRMEASFEHRAMRLPHRE